MVSNDCTHSLLYIVKCTMWVATLIYSCMVTSCCTNCPLSVDLGITHDWWLKDVIITLLPHCYSSVGECILCIVPRPERGGKMTYSTKLFIYTPSWGCFTFVALAGNLIIPVVKIGIENSKNNACKSFQFMHKLNCWRVAS